MERIQKASFRQTTEKYAHTRALHERTDTGEVWMIYNRYEHSLLKTPRGWVVSRLKMETTWQTGNPELLNEAAGTARETKQ